MLLWGWGGCYDEPMKKQKALQNVIYGYTAFAFAAVLLDSANIIHPYGDMLAAIWLLVICYYIGKYGER